MNADTISKLRDCKELLDQGVLTQQEFEEEKKQILSSGQDEINDRQTIVLSEQPIECVAESILPNETASYRIVPVPWDVRHHVMKCSSPQEATTKFDRLFKLSVLFIVIGGILVTLFIYQSGFWAVFFAVFWALLPGISLFVSGLLSFGKWRDMRDRFAKMSQQEFNLVQLDIEQRRQNMVNATGEFVYGAQQSYSAATGGRNMWFDIGSTIGSWL